MRFGLRTLSSYFYYFLFFSLLSILIHTKSAFSIVNIEAVRPEVEGDSEKIDLTGFFILRRGNVDQIQLEANGGVAFRRKNHILFFLGDIAFGTEKGQRFLNQYFAHIRWNWDKYFIIPEVFLQYGFNEFWSLRTRALAGAGPRVRIFKTKNLRFFWGSSFMLEFERLTVGTQKEKEGIFYYRLNEYLSFFFENEKVLTSLVFYVQPRVDFLADFRTLVEGSLRIKITEVLSFTLSAFLYFDSFPPPDVNPLDIEIKNGITFSF